MALKEIDLLAGTKRSNAMGEALLRSALSGKPAYGGIGEALARALTAGMAGVIERRTDEEDRARGASEGGQMARALVEFGRTGNSLSPVPQSPTSALPSPRLPQIGSPQDNQILPENNNDRVAAVFGGMNPQQRDIVTRTMLGEAANQGPLGMQAVADVTKNRADVGGFRTGSTGPTTMDRVVQAPGQYEPHMTAAGRANMASYSPNSPVYQTAQAAVDNASIGGQPDVTGGATHFFSPSVNAKLAAERGDRKAVPDWAAGRQPTAVIGTHHFFNPDGKGQPAQAFAQGPQSSMNDAATDRIIQTIEDPKTSPRMRMFMLQQLQTMVQKPQATLEKLKDDEGREVPYWVNPRTQTLTPAQVPGSGAQGTPAPITLPDGRTLTPPPGVSAKDFRKSVTGNVADAMSGKMTESQGKANSFANRMEAATPIITEMEGVATNLWDSSVRNAGYVPEAAKNWMTSEKHQQYNAAKGRWIAAFLRKDSGAVINPDEFTREDKNYFPQPGEGQDVIEQKRRARQVATEAMKREAGLGYQSPAIPQDSGGWIDLGNGVRVREKR